MEEIPDLVGGWKDDYFKRLYWDTTFHLYYPVGFGFLWFS